MTPEQHDYHDRRYRYNRPNYMLIAALALLGWVVVVAGIDWIAG